MSKEKLAQILLELCASQRAAVLATQSGGQPYCSLMAFAATTDLRYLIFATLRDTRKYRNLAADPRAAMLVDNRTNQASDTQNALAVTATGTAIEVAGAERDRFLRVFLDRQPHLRDFLASPDCAVLGLKVEEYYVVSRFQEVQVFSP